MKNKIGYFLTLLILLGFLVYFLFNYKDFEVLFSLNFEEIILIFFIQSLVVLTNAFFFQIILQSFNINIPLSYGFKVTFLSAIGNYFTPAKGGSGIKAVYLKKDYNLSYSHFISTLAGNYIFVFLIASLSGLAGILLKNNLNDSITQSLIFFYIVIIIISIALIIIDISIITKVFKKLPSNKVFDRVKNIINLIVGGWDSISKNKIILFKLLLTSLVGFAITILLYKVEFHIININLGLPELFIFSSLSSLSLLVSLTPGSLGIREAIFLATTVVIGITNQDVLNVSVLDRASTFIFLLVGYFVIQIYKLTRKILT